MAVDIGATASFTSSTPRVLFSGFRLLSVDSGQTYDITPDGKSLVTTRSSTGSESLTSIKVVLNFFTELKGKSGK
jgi:hypothetical protein